MISQKVRAEVNPAELQEYLDTLLSYGFPSHLFKLAIEETHTKTSPATTVPGSGLIITCVTTQQQKTYPIGIGVPWPKQFAHDLTQGYFGVALNK